MRNARYLEPVIHEVLDSGKMVFVGGPRVVQEDLRDLERVREISLVEQLVDLLPARVGSPLSIAKLRSELEVDHKTVERWLEILENLYVCFRVAPFGAPRIRAVKKERKLYCGTGHRSWTRELDSRISWLRSSSGTAIS